jgi:tetratricopeptide (TPR) repeat protein
MSHIRTRILGNFLLAATLSVGAFAQQLGPLGKKDLGNPESIDITKRYETAPGTGVLVFHVFAEKSGTRLDGQVQLLLTNLANNIGLVQRIAGDQEGIFPNLTPGNYEIEVRALGFFPARQRVQVLTTVQAAPIDIVLHRDPSVVRLEVAEGLISSKARKEARHAVSLLKAGDLDEAQRHLEAADKLSPANSDLNFLFGYLYFQKQNYGRAETYLNTAIGLSPHNNQAMTLLGRTRLQQENYPAARSALEQAVLADPENWLPHNLLADAYLGEKNYNKARDEAQTAIAKGQQLGKDTASSAEIVLGQALIALGHEQEAIHAFDAFLKESSDSSLAVQIQNLVEELKSHTSNATPNGNSQNPEVAASAADALQVVPDLEPMTQAWRPADVDDAKPSVAANVPCPAATVLEESGRRVQELVQNLSRFAADEELFHQSIDGFGFVIRTETRKYDYVAMVSEPEPGSVAIDEYRADKITQAGYPDAIASTGFITLGLVFHPDMQKDFEFNCEGQGEWQGQATWLVHFRQRHDRPNRMHSYNLGSQVFLVDLKGRAWITADKFQIVRTEADMIRPMPEIQLLSEHQVVEYGPVPFPKKETTLWLPKDAEIYFDFRKHHYHRRHSFDHYMLYSVDTQEKTKEPKAVLGEKKNEGSPANQTSN